MAIEIGESMCDGVGCRVVFESGDECYCGRCYDALLDKISNLEEEVQKLSKELDDWEDKASSEAE